MQRWPYQFRWLNRGIFLWGLMVAAAVPAGSVVDDNIVRWQAGKPGSETVNHSGVESRMLVSQGFAVRAGSVFFPAQHYTEATVHIPIGGVVFEIPFTAR